MCICIIKTIAVIRPSLILFSQFIFKELYYLCSSSLKRYCPRCICWKQSIMLADKSNSKPCSLWSKPHFQAPNRELKIRLAAEYF